MIKARRVIVPPYPGLFSALGLLSSDLVYSDNRSAYMILTPGVAENISQIYRTMEKKLLAYISADKQNVIIKRTFDGRLYGQTWETPFIDVPPGEISEETIGILSKNFHDVYEQRTGNRFEMIPVQSVTYRVEVIVPTEKVSYPHLSLPQVRTLQPERVVTLHYVEDGEMEVAEYERAKLQRDDVIRGPAIIREPLSTTHIVRGQIATIGEWGEIVIEEEKG
jgi:N-methylhydantoinase A